MKCNSCKKPLADAYKTVTEYLYPDGTTQATIPSENVTAATDGRRKLLRLWHYKCWKIVEKRERPSVRGEARLTAYDVSAQEKAARDRLHQINADNAADHGFAAQESTLEWPAGGEITAEI